MSGMLCSYNNLHEYCYVRLFNYMMCKINGHTQNMTQLYPELQTLRLVSLCVHVYVCVLYRKVLLMRLVHLLY